MHKKICIWFDDTNWYEKLFLFYKIFAVFAIFMAIAQPDIAIKRTMYKNFVIPKVFIFLNLVIFIQEISEILLRIKIVTEKNVKKYIKPTETKKISDEKEHTLEWISVDNIVYILFKYNWRSNVGFQQEVGKNNILFKKIGDILEKRGVVVRWEKNARILNKEMKDHEIYLKLIAPTLEKVSENSIAYNWV